MKNVVEFYNSYNKDIRLKDRRSRILEKTTTLKYLSEYIKQETIIADIGAGTGIYTLELAQRAKYVIAVDLVEKHITEIAKKAKEKNIRNIKTICGSATNLSTIENNICDVVLCLGPMYHLKNGSERNNCWKECKRIMKTDGVLFVAYINKVLAINYFAKNGKFLTTEMISDIEKSGYIKTKGFDNFLDISYLSDSESIENEAIEPGLKVEKNLATDGISYFIQEQIEKMNEQQWEDYIKLHIDHCEDINSFGMSMHGLLICKN